MYDKSPSLLRIDPSTVSGAILYWGKNGKNCTKCLEKKVNLMSNNSRKMGFLNYQLVKTKDTRQKKYFVAFEGYSLVRKATFRVLIFPYICL